jgi:hypothetical protein
MLNRLGIMTVIVGAMMVESDSILIPLSVIGAGVVLVLIGAFKRWYYGC